MPTTRTVSINRAPVMTLWASVVAERVGFDRPEALSLGRAVAGLNAQSKGRKLGVFRPHEEEPEAARKRGAGDGFLVELCGRAVPAVVTPEGVRAVSRGKTVGAGSVEKYLATKFGDALPAVRRALAKLAASRSPQELAKSAFSLYERFRPEVPAGQAGWGARGTLDLGLIGRLAKERPAAKSPRAAVTAPRRRG
jgi:hypothetical protein